MEKAQTRSKEEADMSSTRLLSSPAADVIPKIRSHTRRRQCPTGALPRALYAAHTLEMRRGQLENGLVTVNWNRNKAKRFNCTN